MTKNLETADLIVKLVLAAGTVVLFFAGVIAGPFAQFLVIVSAVIIAIFLVKLISPHLKPLSLPIAVSERTLALTTD